MNLDLDKARAARADADKEPLGVKLGGKTFKAKRPLSMATIVAAGELQEGDLSALKRVVAGIFGKSKAQAVLDAGLDFADLPLLLEALLGGDEGEAGASTG